MNRRAALHWAGSRPRRWMAKGGGGRRSEGKEERRAKPDAGDIAQAAARRPWRAPLPQLRVDTGGKRSRLSCRCSSAGPFLRRSDNGATGWQRPTKSERGAREVRPGRAAGGGGASGCCSTASSCCDPITANLYDAAQGGEVPADALAASLGCGNPTALAELKPGETVLDLGSGGGIDVLLSARRVGPTARRSGST